MAELKISVITTVLNEEDSIHSLLDSLLHQSRLPDELIIIDGGSTDDTVAVAKNHRKEASFPIRVITARGTNRSQGRNRGIASAAHNHIAVIDAGCEADPVWLESIESGFSEGYEVVAGFLLALD